MSFFCFKTTVIIVGLHVGLGNSVRSGVTTVVPFPGIRTDSLLEWKRGAEDKGGIMLSIQGQQRNKMSNEYVDTPKCSNQIRRRIVQERFVAFQFHRQIYHVLTYAVEKCSAIRHYESPNMFAIS
jgi:hypothetical protein